MHNRKVIALFSALVLFSAGLLIFELYRFGSVTGNVAADTVEKSADLPFGVRIVSLSVENGQLNANVIFSSDKSTRLFMQTYAINDYATVNSLSDTVFVNGASNYNLKLDLPQNADTHNELILYVTDGTGEIKLSKTVEVSSVTGLVTSSAEKGSGYLLLSFAVGCCIILIIILVGVFINKHRKESKLLTDKPNQRQFIDLKLQ